MPPSPRMLPFTTFRLLFVFLVLLDILWWLWADRRLRPLRAARWWRGLLALFMVVVIATIAMPIGWPSRGYGLDGAMPMALRMVQILWHLIVLLPFMIGLTVVILLRLIWRGIHWGGMKIAACFRTTAAEPPAAVAPWPPRFSGPTSRDARG